MSIAPGKTLGVYQVVALIGAGGMGEVYRARDTKLHRDVALKVLPDFFAGDAHRLARLQREAEILASLNHPNIGTIHGLEEGDGVRALVLELVEGPTLAGRIAQGPIALDEALPIARQVAEALEAAHEHGIVHRDLKPSNIKVRPDGLVKVLDFGLAKAVHGDPAGYPSTSPTLTNVPTGAGGTVGTAAYMSPEQARGKPVDKRTDIWAFGCVLYEMLTGRRAFEGGGVSDVLARIIEREPDFNALPPTTPPAIRRLLRRSLEKDRRQRLSDIADARLEIDEALAANPLRGEFHLKGSSDMRRYCLLFLAAFVLLPVTTEAQGLSGTLFGTVKDEQGGVLPGALVRVTSPALIGGELTTTTNDKGQLRFPVLAPGSYALTIELLPRFASYREENISIGAGATLERTVVLTVAGVAETVVVEGSSRIEALSSGFETRFGSEYLRTIPTRRFSMFDLIKAAPGVSPTSPASGTVNTVSVFGSAVNENAFLIDGTNFTCPCQGVSRAEPSVDVIQEVQVQSIGASVEYGNLQGAVFNVITRQGGDRFQYDASYYAQMSALTSQPVVRPVSNGSVPSSGYERDRYRDFTTNLGGPVLRERIWFFGGYQYLRDYDSQPGADPKFPRAYEQDKIFGKLTWRLTPNLQLMQSFHEEFWVNANPPTLVTPFAATLRLKASVPSMTFGHLTHTLSSNTVWDVRVSHFGYTREDESSTGDRTTPNRFDRNTGISSGNVPQIGGLTLNRVTAKAVLNRYQPGMLGGDHQLRVGTEVERGEHHQPAVIPGGVRFVDNSNGQPFQAVSRAPSIAGGRFNAVAVFASDSVTMSDRVTVNAGLRFDHSDAISQDVPALDAAGFETDGIVRGLGKLYTWNLVSPRLGVTAKLSADGRTMLRASYGRFNQGMLTGELSPIHPGVTSITTMAFDAATGRYTSLVSVVDPKINLALDPDTRPPHSDEYSVGVDREITPRLAASVAYIRKNGSDFIAWTDVGGQYREETRTLADGRSLPVFVLTNSTAVRRFLLTNPGDYSLTYNGLVVALDKRRSNGWQAFGSYTFSRTSGLQASSGATADGAQLSTVAPNDTFGRDPNNLTNAEGRLPNDRPHIFRVMGTVEVPRTGFSVAANLQHFSGKPWTATAQVSLPPPQGDQRILLERRGSRRLSSQSLLDLRVSRMFGVGAGRVELLLDILNVLNDTAAEALATDNLFSPTFGQPTVFMDPRRAMVGVRLNLGR